MGRFVTVDIAWELYGPEEWPAYWAERERQGGEFIAGVENDRELKPGYVMLVGRATRPDRSEVEVSKQVPAAADISTIIDTEGAAMLKEALEETGGRFVADLTGLL